MSESYGMQPEITDDVKRTWQKCRLDRSAGGIAYRRVPDRETIEIALIATRNGTRWQLPKGSLESDETARQTAVREVAEEVGLVTEIQCYLQRIEFWYWDTYRKNVAELVHKQVDFFLMKIVGGELSDSSHEVDAVSWFTVEQALEILTFDGERDVVRRSMAILQTEGSSQSGH